METIIDVIKSRRSIRRFKRDEKIPREDLMKILEASIYAPSAGNRQPWEYIIIEKEDLKRKIAEAAYNQMWITEAPTVIVVCANENRSALRYGERGRTLYCIQDTAAAIQNILLTAHSMGYGTCWVGAFDEEEVRRILDIPIGVRPVAIIPIGKPNEKPSMPPRIPLEKLLHYDKY
ncbi:MAG: nitroreductase family protein [Candidatus Methanomethylicia archaeon]